MANYSASDVKKLRDETDAPMMECKTALEEADGNFERAKEILREKGQAAAGKKAGRATGAGVVAFSLTADAKKAGAVVVECETDFVSNNPEFGTLAQKVADYVRDNGAPAGAPMDDPKLKELAAEIVAVFRENVVIAKAQVLETAGTIMTYVHHDKSKGAAILVDGPATEEVRKVAIQAVAFPPEALKKEDLPQEKIAHELEVETKRALEEGKPENIAKNIAQGRVNKEYIKKVVLLEQPFYIDPAKSVAQYLAESAKGSSVTGFVYLAVGQQ